jgi:predicted GTPase
MVQLKRDQMIEAKLKEDCRSALISNINALLLESWVSPVNQSILSRLLEKIKSRSLNILLVGQYKRGKSSLVNAILGTDLLPVGVLPLTSVITFVSRGPAGAIVRFISGEEMAVSLDRVCDFVTEENNPKNRKSVKEVVIHSDHPLLATGARLIDTPGIDSLHEHNSKTTFDFLPEADAAIFVLSADQPLSSQELLFLRKARPYLSKLILAINKVDLVSPLEQEAIKDFVSAALNAEGAVIPEIFTVSSKNAMRDDSQMGLSALKLRLMTLIQSDKGAMETQSAAVKLSAVIDSEVSLINSQMQFLQADEELRRRKLLELHSIQERAEKTLADLKVLFRAEFQEFIKKLNTFTENRLAQITEANKTSYSDALASNSRSYLLEGYKEIQGNLALQIGFTADSINEFVGEHFSSLVKRYQENAQALFDSTAHTASEAFQLQFASLAENHFLQFHQKRISFNPTISLTSFSLLRIWFLKQLPLRWVGRFLRKHLIEASNEALAMNFERLRWDAIQDLEKDYFTATARLGQSLKELLSTLDNLLVGALRDTRSNARSSEEVYCLLEERKRTLDQLQFRL